jgi:glycosyltransferase involved in cell wall biosynthesis
MPANVVHLVVDASKPLRDVIEPGVNGLLLDFFDVDGLARTLAEAVERPEAFAELRRAARRTATASFDQRTVCLPQWLALVDRWADA